MTYTPETLKAQLASWRNRFISTDEFEECVISCAAAWEAQTSSHLEWVAEQGRMIGELRQRLEAVEKAQLEFVAMLCHNNGGEIRLMPVLLRGDEEVVVWDNPLTLERVYRIRSSALAAREEK